MARYPRHDPALPALVRRLDQGHAGQHRGSVTAMGALFRAEWL